MLGASHRAQAVAVAMELPFPSPAQDLCYRWLDKAVYDRRYTPFALGCAGLGNLGSSHRRWTVASVQPWCLDVGPVLFEVIRQCVYRHAIDTGCTFITLAGYYIGWLLRLIGFRACIRWPLPNTCIIHASASIDFLRALFSHHRFLPPTHAKHFAPPAGGCQVILQDVHDAGNVHTFSRQVRALLCLLLTGALRPNPMARISLRSLRL